MQMTMIMFEKKTVFVVAFIQTHLNLLTAMLLPACLLDCMLHSWTSVLMSINTFLIMASLNLLALKTLIYSF